MNGAKNYLTAREAAAELNIAKATLYAYVSRGLIRSEPGSAGRGRRYSAADVRLLRARKSPDSQGPDNTLKRDSLNFGSPVLNSAITLIQDNRLYYRGRDAAQLAREARFEQVANLLWGMEDEDPFLNTGLQEFRFSSMGSPLADAVSFLSQAADHDMRAFNPQRLSVAQVGADIIRILTSAFSPVGDGSVGENQSIPEKLALGWGCAPHSVDALRAALILSADHELNASTFTVRCVASTGATPYAAVIAGLSALQGPKHGGISAQVSAFFAEVDHATSPKAAVQERLRRGERLPGFGHPLYPTGDVRATVLLEILRRDFAATPGMVMADQVLTSVEQMVGLKPNIDFATAALARAADLPAGSPFAIFAVGRAAGWIAHVQEQYRMKKLIRPRARYVGEEPQTAHENRAIP